METKLISTVLIILMMYAGLRAQTPNNMKTQTNPTAPVKCSKSIVINASSEKVWQILIDINRWSSWQKDISNPELKGEAKPNATFKWKTGGAKIHSTLHTVEANSYFGWTGKTFGMFAIHNWSLAEANGKTTVIVDETMEGFLASLFQTSFNKNLEKGMVRWLEFLKIESEK